MTSAIFKEVLLDRMSECGETLSDIEVCTLSEEEFERSLDEELQDVHDFTIWTCDHIYIPQLSVDLSVTIDRIPRNPD